MREAGIKTEPAFCEYFRLQGDPYEVLYHLADASDDELSRIVRNHLLTDDPECD